MKKPSQILSTKIETDGAAPLPYEVRDLAQRFRVPVDAIVAFVRAYLPVTRADRLVTSSGAAKIREAAERIDARQEMVS